MEHGRSLGGRENATKTEREVRKDNGAREGRERIRREFVSLVYFTCNSIIATCRCANLRIFRSPTHVYLFVQSIIMQIYIIYIHYYKCVS